MEKITPEVIAHTAMLSRITLTKEESAAMEKHFAALLGQMAALEGFDASAVPATAHILPAVNVLRASRASLSTAKNCWRARPTVTRTRTSFRAWWNKEGQT